MKKQLTTHMIKCDTVLCNQNAFIKLSTNSFKGDTFLCEKCYLELKNLLKKENKTSER